ncbi:MAG: hypothetical protein IPO22_11335 [Anaerolineales bacterium]|nr:hypothetical protein [Anaerolineales bacterium]
MKRISYIFLLSVFLTSCAAVAAPTATATPQATFTVTPTFTPTITPTITLTPTETPDPNRPDDATGKDLATGEYTKSVEENGKTTVYVWKPYPFGDDVKNGITGHWFKSRMENGPINLITYGETCKDSWGGPYTLNMSVYAVEGLTDLDWLGNIYQPDRQAEWDKYNDLTEGGIGCTSIPLPNRIMYDLFLRYINLLPSDSSQNKYLRLNDYYYPGGAVTAEGAQLYADTHDAFKKAMTDGEMTIKIGDNLWFPVKGYEVYWITESMAINDPSMEALRDNYLKVMVDDGKLIAFIAVTKFRRNNLIYGKEIYRELTFNQLILNPLELAITNTFPIKDSIYFTPYDYYGRTGIPSGTVNDQYFYINLPFIAFAPYE